MSDKDIHEKTAQDELARAKSEAHDYLEGWQRARADYANLKKETDKKLQEISEYANIPLLVEILSVYGNVAQAIRHLPSEYHKSDWALGLFHTKRQFEDVIRSIGLEQIKSVGQKFDPSLHEAVSHEKVEGAKPDYIFHEVKPGYTFRGKTILAAKVKVAE